MDAKKKKKKMHFKAAHKPSHFYTKSVTATKPWSFICIIAVLSSMCLFVLNHLLHWSQQDPGWECVQSFMASTGFISQGFTLQIDIGLQSWTEKVVNTQNPTLHTHSILSALLYPIIVYEEPHARSTDFTSLW